MVKSRVAKCFEISITFWNRYIISKQSKITSLVLSEKFLLYNLIFATIWQTVRASDGRALFWAAVAASTPFPSSSGPKIVWIGFLSPSSFPFFSSLQNFFESNLDWKAEEGNFQQLSSPPPLFPPPLFSIFNFPFVRHAWIAISSEGVGWGEGGLPFPLFSCQQTFSPNSFSSFLRKKRGGKKGWRADYFCAATTICQKECSDKNGKSGIFFGGGKSTLWPKFWVERGEKLGLPSLLLI